MPNPRKHLLRAVAIAGSQANLARKVRVTPQAVNQWLRRGGSIAAEYCPSIEEATGGAVRCEDLNPTVRWRVLRAAPAAGRRA